MDNQSAKRWPEYQMSAQEFLEKWNIHDLDTIPRDPYAEMIADATFVPETRDHVLDFLWLNAFEKGYDLSGGCPTDIHAH